jgi:hypothetical protein
MSNLKYAKTPDLWQEALDLHVVINTVSTIKDVECANYCTIRDSRFRYDVAGNYRKQDVKVTTAGLGRQRPQGSFLNVYLCLLP